MLTLKTHRNFVKVKTKESPKKKDTIHTKTTGEKNKKTIKIFAIALRIRKRVR